MAQRPCHFEQRLLVGSHSASQRRRLDAAARPVGGEGELLQAGSDPLPRARID